MKNGLMKKWVLVITGVLLVGVSGVLILWFLVFKTSIKLDTGEQVSFYVPTGSGFEEVINRLEEMEIISHPDLFRSMAIRKNLPRHIYPGHYLISEGMSHNALINMLRAGKQVPEMVTFHNIRTMAQLSGRIAAQIETDSASLHHYLSSPETLQQFGLTPEALAGIFIPNTYELYWNSTPEAFVRRMVREYERFWTGERKDKAAKLKLTPNNVSTLASIIDEETRFDEEKATIAGVYINRLRKGIPLQADPTIKFALNDFDKSRILTTDLNVNSPYNTYRNRGIPPGPIRIPSIAAIDAVLNHEQHDYLYFCARDDFSGYHHFSRTLQEHNRYAQRYRKALDQRRIWK